MQLMQSMQNDNNKHDERFPCKGDFSINTVAPNIDSLIQTSKQICFCCDIKKSAIWEYEKKVSVSVKEAYRYCDVWL